MSISANIQHDIKTIREAADNKRLVLFVGAGVSANSGVPVWSELIEKLKTPFTSACDKNTDDLKAAQLYLDTYGRKDFLETVRTTLNVDNAQTCDIHKLLLALNPQHIITTNYDTLLEDAASEQLQKYSVIRTDTDIPYCNESNTIVKMHGDFVHGNIVLAEEDYLNYARNFPLIRTYVQSLFAKNLVLFIGFSFNDINLKYILQDVQSVLQNDMQRAYLLTSDEISHASRLYYEHRGVHVVSITPTEIKQTNIRPYVGSNKMSSKGLILYQQLSLIKLYKEEKTLIQSTIDFLNSIDGQLIPHPEGLRYIVRDVERCSWNLHTSGLQLESKEIKRIKSLIGKNKFAAYRSLLESYGSDLKTLGTYARANLLVEVDDVTLLKGSNFEHDSIDAYYEYNMREISHVIKENRTTDKEKLRDLEYPYLLCLNGKFSDAYAEYKMLAGVYYNRKKYILYFLCLYNIVNMYSRILNQRFHEGFGFDDKIQQEIEEIDLHSILTKLPVSSYVRRILQDILVQKFQLDILAKILKYKNLLTDQRVSSEHGGVSVNSNCALLDTCVNRYLLFCHNNYLLCYDDNLSRQIYTEYVQGVLESFATQENIANNLPLRCSKITAIEKFHLIMMIFHMDAKELQLCFKRARVDTIKAETESLDYFNKMITNIIENIKNAYVGPVAGGTRYWDVLQNVIYLYSRLSNEQQTRDVFPIVHYLLLHIPVINSIPIHRLLANHAPTIAECKDLLYSYIDRHMSHHGEFGIVGHLAEILDNEGEKLDAIGSMNQLPFNNMTVDEYIACYHVMIPSVQRQVVEAINERIDSLPKLMEAHIKGIPILSENTLGRFMPPDFSQKHNFRHPKELVCSELAKVRKDASYESIHQLIDKFFNDDVCFRFFMDPLSCLKTFDVAPQWIISQTDEIIKLYLANDLYRQKIKALIQSEKISQKTKDRIIGLL